MIALLFTLILSEMGLIIIFVFKTPLRKLVILGLDRLKRGKAPIVVNTISATVFILMLTSLYNVVSIRRRSIDADVNPTDQILAATHLLEASLMGFSLFLGLMIDRLHHYIRELRVRRKNMEAVKKQNRASEDGKAGEMKSLEEERATLVQKVEKLETELKEKRKEVGTLLQKVEKLETEIKEKSKEVSNAEENSVALKKQSEGFLLEYDRLVEENQNLRSQLQSLDRRLSFSENRKVT